MGFMEELKKLARPYSEEGEEYDDYNAVPKTKERKNAQKDTTATDNADLFSSSSTGADYAADPKPSRKSGSSGTASRDGKVVNIHTTAVLSVVLVKPDRFDSVSEVAEHLREKRAVVLNLESTNKDVARRLVDFLSGCAYALDGKIKKVAVSTYIITPYNVDIMGDLIDELENNGLYI